MGQYLSSNNRIGRPAFVDENAGGFVEREINSQWTSPAREDADLCANLASEQWGAFC